MFLVDAVSSMSGAPTPVDKWGIDVCLAGLQKAGFTTFGGVNAPYVWLKTPDGVDSVQERHREGGDVVELMAQSASASGGVKSGIPDG